MSFLIDAIKPNWDVPDFIHSMVTLRSGGVSRGKYDSFNLATHVDDSEEAVLHNRQFLKKKFNLPAEPFWLDQAHSTNVVELPTSELKELKQADASWTCKVNTICAVLTADCLPVFFYHPVEHRVAVAHAGWRGLADGILEKTATAMTSSPEYLKVWLGPAIGPEKFEVGEEVKNLFCKDDDSNEDAFVFSTTKAGKKYYFADIYRLAKRRLYNAGVISISGGNFCTVNEPQRFYSYRRDGQTGRMASLIWFSEY
ncbi:MAG: peptidoglycan editing factor PgeF [Gammaproteobacteria bacterium]|nr:peptidoglycan editing factor PgeF [Gammaproteobacteria bacterium]